MRKTRLVATIAVLLGLSAVIVWVTRPAPPARTAAPPMEVTAPVAEALPAPPSKPERPVRTVEPDAKQIWQARWRQSLRAGVRRLTWALVWARDHQAAMGRWPTPKVMKSLNLDDRDRLASEWVGSAGFTAPGVFDLQFSALAGAGSVQFRLQSNNPSLEGWWDCTSSDRSDIQWILPQCRFVGTAPAATVAAPSGVDLAKLNVIGTALGAGAGERVEFLEAFFHSVGQWPSPAQPGFALPAIAAPWVEATAYDQTGHIEMRLNAAAGGGVLHWHPQILDGRISWWQCSSLDRADVHILLPGCLFLGDGVEPTLPSMTALVADGPRDIADVRAFRAAVRDDLAVRSAVLTALTEYQMVGRPWPTQQRMFGTHPIARTFAVADIQMQAELQLEITLTEAAGGGTLLMELVPGAAAGMPGWWRCRSDRADMHLILPECEYHGVGAPVADHAAWPDPLLRAEQRRQLAAQVQAAAGTAQIAVQEYVAAFGTEWSEQFRERIRVPAPEQFANPWLQRLELTDDLGIDVHVSELMGGGTLRFTAVWSDGLISHWTCSSADRADAVLLLPGCVFSAGV